jgi:TolB-like protein/Tfp pilus assembly protein PilF
MFTDMVGYTAMTQSNESMAIEALNEHHLLLKPFFPRFHGREVKAIGDSLLAEFDSALDALRCAIDIQSYLHDHNASSSEGWKIKLRIGIHLGDVVHQSGDTFGDAVNIASRIEPVAEPEGVCISEQVYYQVQNKSPYPLVKLPSRGLKNVRSQIEIYKVVMPWEGTVAAMDRTEKNRIVVLPLVNISSDQKDEFFADGMTDELIGTLSKIRGLKVVARTSAMRYKGEKKTANEIGRELHVSSLLEGSVRKDGNMVRISLQLVDTASEEQLWTDKYDRELQNIFSLQSEIAERVAGSLEVKLRDTEPSLLAKRQTEDIGAYTLYLRGRYHWNSRSEEGLNKAVKCFEEAIARDPSYALAHAGLADCYSMLGLYGFRRPSSMYPLAKESIARALSIDDTLAEAHASMGEVMMQYYYDWKRARTELDQALKLNPNYATAHLWKSTYHLTQGSLDGAFAELNAARELDPLSMINETELGKTFYYARRYEEAIEQYNRSMEIDPNFALAHKGLSEVYAKQSRFDRALEEIEKAIELSKRSIFILDDLGYIYALSGRKSEAEKVLDELEMLSTEFYVPPYGRAAIYAGLGDADRAMEWLGRAYEERSFLAWIKLDPVFDGLREDKRFGSFLEKLGLG